MANPLEMAGGVSVDAVKFDEDGLVAAVAQDERSGELLMLAYMDRAALEATVSTGRAHFWSRSRKKQWLKGETSGNYLNVSAIRYDCDADALLLSVRPEGPACHTGERSCFYRTFASTGVEAAGAGVLAELYGTAVARKGAPPDKSYTASLYAKGMQAIVAKVKEESGELIEAAESKADKDVVHETADLLFHVAVLLAQRGIELDEVFKELKKRTGRSGHEEKASRPKKG